MAPRVSVLIPVYNCAPWIAAAIESVLAQTYQDFEIIVADDGSTDQTVQIVQRYPRVQYLFQPHSGISAARNLALSKARGELIAFLDADDLWAPNKLALQVSYLDAHPECKIIFCHYHNFTDIPEEKLTLKQKQLLRTEVPLFLAGSCIRKELFNQIGNFNIHYCHSEDTEWVISIKMHGVDISHRLDETLYLRRVHNGNITLTHNGMGHQQYYSMMSKLLLQKLKKDKAIRQLP